MSNASTDVPIVGAGPTGLKLAKALATGGINTTVVDREPVLSALKTPGRIGFARRFGVC
jgi:2-polyprenyl-6-methoxyphenol hydroxylase-like FAD-dependent oxidoreductase